MIRIKNHKLRVRQSFFIPFVRLDKFSSFLNVRERCDMDETNLWELLLEFIFTHQRSVIERHSFGPITSAVFFLGVLCKKFNACLESTRKLYLAYFDFPNIKSRHSPIRCHVYGWRNSDFCWVFTLIFQA